MKQLRVGVLGLGVLAMVGCGAVAPGEEEGVSEQPLLATGGFAGTSGGGAAPIIFTAVADTELEEAQASVNEGAQDYCQAKGGSDKRHCLLRWDTSSLPTSTVVQSAQIELLVTDPSASTYHTYEMLRTWTEMGATWNVAQPGTPWQVPGAWGAIDSGGAIAGSDISAPSNAVVIVQLPPSLVQKWVSNPSANFGIMIANNNSYDGLTIATHEQAGSGSWLAIYKQ